MTKPSHVIFILGVDVICLAGSITMVFMIFDTLKKIQSIEQENTAILQQPYFSEDVRSEQKNLLIRSQSLTNLYIQDPTQSIDVIQEIEALAVKNNLQLAVRLEEDNQQTVGALTAIPIRFTGSGPWIGLMEFQKELQLKKPGFFLDSASLTNQEDDQVAFNLHYTILWQGEL